MVLENFWTVAVRTSRPPSCTYSTPCYHLHQGSLMLCAQLHSFQALPALVTGGSHPNRCFPSTQSTPGESCPQPRAPLSLPAARVTRAFGPWITTCSSLCNNSLLRHLRLASLSARRVTTTHHRRLLCRFPCLTQQRPLRLCHCLVCFPIAAQAHHQAGSEVSHGVTTTFLHNMQRRYRSVRLLFTLTRRLVPRSSFLLHTRVFNILLRRRA
jgi:hypothetical protein